MENNEALDNFIADCKKNNDYVKSEAYKKWVHDLLSSGNTMDSEDAEYLDGEDGHNGRLLYLYFSYIESIVKERSICYHCKIDDIFFAIGISTVYRPIVSIKQCHDKFVHYIEL